MSGTSRDGIDLAAIDFTCKNGQWHYAINTAETLAYTEKWEDDLARAHRLSDDELLHLNENYTVYLAETINRFIEKHALENIDAICSHGHTVLHQPDHGLTLQIGNLPKLADLLQKKVVCDFRSQDVALGGQGAPLVPIGDERLFSDYAACVNLGGFANISMKINGKRLAFDVCAVNVVLNVYAQKCGENYDDGGKLAAAGNVDNSLLKKLNALEFYNQNPPKSLGVEWANARVFPLLEASGLPPKTILATYTTHIADQLLNVFSEVKEGEILITGGGAYNTHLIDLLKEKTSAQIHIPDAKLIDFKEALIFGFLGVLKLRGETNVLKSVTGAERGHSSGKIYLFLK